MLIHHFITQSNFVLQYSNRELLEARCLDYEEKNPTVLQDLILPNLQSDAFFPPPSNSLLFEEETTISVQNSY